MGPCVQFVNAKYCLAKNAWVLIKVSPLWEMFCIQGKSVTDSMESAVDSLLSEISCNYSVVITANFEVIHIFFLLIP
jgi:hypothetical protein